MACTSVPTASEEITETRKNPYREKQWPHSVYPDSRTANIAKALSGANAIVHILTAEADVRTWMEISPLGDNVYTGLLHALDSCISNATSAIEGFEGKTIHWGA